MGGAGDQRPRARPQLRGARGGRDRADGPRVVEPRLDRAARRPGHDRAAGRAQGQGDGGRAGGGGLPGRPRPVGSGPEGRARPQPRRERPLGRAARGRGQGRLYDRGLAPWPGGGRARLRGLEGAGRVRRLRLGVIVGDAAEEALAPARRLREFILLIALAVSVLIASLGLVIARGITRPLERTVEVLDAVAAGDLTRQVEVDSRDELGLMASALDEAVAAIRAALVSI